MMVSAKVKLVEVVEVLTTSGTWFVPVGCTSVDVWMIGGGGAGASGVTGSGPDGCGGGSGFIINQTISVTPGSLISYIIGAGGDITSPNSGEVHDGGSTSFGSLVAEGGKGGGNRHSTGKGGNGTSGGGYDGNLGGLNGTNGKGSNPGIGNGMSEICPFNNVQYGGAGSGGTATPQNSSFVVHPNVGYPSSDRDGIGYAGNSKPNTGAGGSAGWGGGCHGGAGGSGVIVLRYLKRA
ncbi:hypothetical protein DW103_17460 [Parabacteroides sp. AM08-6]|nr:hypothetical protein DW103_17460 [Parabacteroides sp. AM08-6]